MKAELQIPLIGRFEHAAYPGHLLSNRDNDGVLLID
jgi:hypothetical protein